MPVNMVQRETVADWNAHRDHWELVMVLGGGPGGVFVELSTGQQVFVAGGHGLRPATLRSAKTLWVEQPGNHLLCPDCNVRIC